LHRPLLLFCLSLIALASASLAGVCGDPDAVGTPTADVAAVASVLPPATIDATDTPIVATATVSPDTPVPTATLEDEPTSAPDRMNSLPTASSTSDVMVLHGWMYLDARPARGTVQAFVEGRLCGEGSAAPLADEEGLFGVEIESDAQQPGCGLPGASVTVTIDGVQVDQAVEWQAGYSEALRLSAGAAVAFYRGTLSVGGELDASARVVPYVGDVVCGAAAHGSIWPQDHSRWLFQLTVDPDEVTPGCGQRGADVTFVLSIDGHPDRVITRVPWQPLPPVVLPNVDMRQELAATPAAESTP
jgi:hypothetical protein